MLSGSTSGSRFERYHTSKQDHRQPLKTLLVYPRATEQQRWVQFASMKSAMRYSSRVLGASRFWCMFAVFVADVRGTFNLQSSYGLDLLCTCSGTRGLVWVCSFCSLTTLSRLHNTWSVFPGRLWLGHFRTSKK